MKQSYYDKLIQLKNEGKVKFVLQFGGSRCSTNMVTRALTHSPDINDTTKVRKIRTRNYDYGSDDNWKNLHQTFTDHEPADDSGYPVTLLVKLNSAEACHPEVLKKYLSLSKHMLFVTRDPQKHSLSLSKGIVRQQQTLLDPISSTILGLDVKADNYTTDAAIGYLAHNVASKAGYDSWEKYLKYCLDSNDFTGLDEIFSTLGYDNYNFEKGLIDHPNLQEFLETIPILVGKEGYNKTLDILKEARKRDGKTIVVVDTAALQCAPEIYFEELCDTLELSYGPSVIKDWYLALPEAAYKAWNVDSGESTGIRPPTQPPCANIATLPTFIQEQLPEKMETYLNLLTAPERIACKTTEETLNLLEKAKGSTNKDIITLNPLWVYSQLSINVSNNSLTSSQKLNSQAGNILTYLREDNPHLSRLFDVVDIYCQNNFSLGNSIEYSS